MGTHSVFENRVDAGSRLAQALLHLRPRRPLVLALPRGGVPVAFEVASALEAPLDVALVRKIGAPQFEELALAAVVDGATPALHVNETLVQQLQPPAGWIDAQMRQKLQEIERRRRLYCGDRSPPRIQDRCVIVVDDGVATGASVRAAIGALRSAGPEHLVLAVPVAPADVAQALSAEVDELVCLQAPRDFESVGRYYHDFRQVEDREVIELLSAAQGRVGLP